MLHAGFNLDVWKLDRYRLQHYGKIFTSLAASCLGLVECTLIGDDVSLKKCNLFKIPRKSLDR